MSEILIELGREFRPYQYQASLAIVATLLVIFGNQINGFVKKAIAKQHFIIRTLVFVLLCAFGYGLATVFLTQLLNQQLSQLANLYLLPTILAIFILLGAYAQKQRHI